MTGDKRDVAFWLALAALSCLATSAIASSGLVYQGRAVFESVQPVAIPKPFTGTWAQSLKMCKARTAKGKLLVMSHSIGKIPLSRVMLNPGQAPDYTRAIVETGYMGTGRILILQLDGNADMTVTVMGQSRVSRYRRCV